MGYDLIENTDMAVKAISDISEDFETFFDIESDGLYVNPRLIQLYQPSSDTKLVIDLYGPAGKLDVNRIVKALKPLWLIGYNVSYDFHTLSFISDKHDDIFYLYKMAYPESNEIVETKYGPAPMSRYGLENAAKVVDWEKLDVDHKNSWIRGFPLSKRSIEYAFRDVELLEKLWDLPKIQKERYTFSYILDNNAQRIVHNNLSLHGLPVCQRLRNEKLVDIRSELDNTKLSKDINVNSFKQVRDLLGSESSDDSALATMEYEGNKDAANIRKIRSYLKTINFLETYKVDNIKGYFNAGGAKSGRYTCKGSKLPQKIEYNNLQQIPRQLKHILGTQDIPGMSMVGTDFSQIELRLAASLWGIDSFIHIYKAGRDIHMETAVSLMRKDPKDVTDEERKLAKACNFGLLYGMMPKTFMSYLKDSFGILVDFDEATDLRRAWLNTFPEVAEHHEKMSKVFRSSGKFLVRHTLGGRSLGCRTLNEALNLEVQGSGADLLKLVKARAIKEADNKDIEIRYVNAVHDSLTSIQYTNELEIVRDIMANSVKSGWDTFQEILTEGSEPYSIYTPGCPLPVEIEISDNYKDVS